MWQSWVTGAKTRVVVGPLPSWWEVQEAGGHCMDSPKVTSLGGRGPRRGPPASCESGLVWDKQAQQSRLAPPGQGTDRGLGR